MKASLQFAKVFLVVFIIIIAFTVISTLLLDEKERNFLGVGLYIVRSDSMSLSDKNADLDDHFKTGDLIFVNKSVNANLLKAGDIICFISTNRESYGKTVTHMIREVKRDERGNLLGYITFGTHTGINDEALALPQNLLGVYIGKISDIGTFFVFLKSPSGYFLCVMLPLLILFCYNCLSTALLSRKYKKESAAAFIAALEKIKAERNEAKRKGLTPSFKKDVQPKPALHKPLVFYDKED